MKYTKSISLKISNQQYETLNKLKDKNIVTSKFIRQAIREKIKREYNDIIKPPIKNNCPF